MNCFPKLHSRTLQWYCLMCKKPLTPDQVIQNTSCEGPPGNKWRIVGQAAGPLPFKQ